MKKTISIIMAICFVTTMMLAGFNLSTTAAVAAAANAKVSNAQGVDSKSVKIGFIGPLSGPVAIVGIPMLRGMQSYFSMINDAGGINGRKIELISKDDSFRGDLAVQKAEELVEKEEVFAIVGQCGTAGSLATVSYFKEIGIPAVYQASGVSKFSKIKNNYFPVQPNYTFETGLITSYALNTLKSKKIAIIYENNDIGKEGLSGLKAKLAQMKKGAYLGAAIPYNPTEVDFSSHIRVIAKAKPDVLIVYGNVKPAAGIILEAKKQGLQAKIMTSYITADVTMFGLAKDAMNGVITTAWVPDITDASNKGAKKFVDTFVKYNPGQTPNAFAAAGWVAAEVFTAGLKKAGNDLSWGNFTKSMETLNNWNGDLVNGITYTKYKRNGVEKMYFMKAVYTDAKNYKYEKISDFVSASSK